MKITAVANQKGGVGKTSTVLGLCSAGAHLGYRLLGVDLDPQANLTRGLGVQADDLDQSQAPTVNELLKVMQDGTATEAIHRTKWDGVDVIPATLDLAQRDLDGAADVIFRLKASFEGCDFSDYDAVLIDCPPSVGRLLTAGLVAADQVLYVTIAQVDAIQGISNIEQTTEFVQRRVNPNLKVIGIAITRRERTGEENYREDELREVYGDMVARTVIPKRTAWTDINGLAEPIHSIRGNAGARALSGAFTDLFQELPLLDRTSAPSA